MGTTAPPPVAVRTLGDLFTEEYQPMVRLALLLTGSNEVAEDVVQDCFVRLGSRFDSVDNPGGYLRMSVVNACRSYHRKRARDRSRPWPKAESLSLGASELGDALATLPYRQRAAIVLRFYEDRTEAEIANALGCRVGTVGPLLHRGLAKLREVIPQ